MVKVVVLVFILLNSITTMEQAFSIKFGNTMKYDIQIKLFNFVYQKGNFCEVEFIINHKLSSKFKRTT